MSRPSSISESEKQLEDALKPAEDSTAHHQYGRNESQFADDALGSKPEQMRDSEEDKTTTEQSDVEKLDPHAKVDYSIFTTGQKRAIVVAGSFAGWFRFVQHEEMQENANEVQPDDRFHLLPSSDCDSERPERHQLKDQHYRDYLLGTYRLS